MFHPSGQSSILCKHLFDLLQARVLRILQQIFQRYQPHSGQIVHLVVPIVLLRRSQAVFLADRPELFKGRPQKFFGLFPALLNRLFW